MSKTGKDTPTTSDLLTELYKLGGLANALALIDNDYCSKSTGNYRVDGAISSLIMVLDSGLERAIRMADELNG